MQILTAVISCYLFLSNASIVEIISFIFPEFKIVPKCKCQCVFQSIVCVLNSSKYMTDGFKNPIICFAKCGSTGGKNDRFCSWVKDLMRCSVCLYLKTYIQNWANLFAFKIATKTQATWPKLNNSTNFMLLGFTFF